VQVRVPGAAPVLGVAPGAAC